MFIPSTNLVIPQLHKILYIILLYLFKWNYGYRFFRYFK